MTCPVCLRASQGIPFLQVRPAGLTCFFIQGATNPPACFDSWLAAFHILEMLYDSPFPTEPRNDLVPTKTERNAEIRARYEQGETVSELTTAFDISEQRVSQIIHGRRN
jgi:hypothetical protein